MFNKLITSIFVLVLLLGAVQPVSADGGNKKVNFGSCVNPQWKVSQVNKGNDHGVVGANQSYSGTDTIYTSGSNALQCLCADNGKGYETKWMDASGLSSSEVATYKKDGWIYVATGANWGLKDVAYLAKNSDFSCKGLKVAAASNAAAAKPSVAGLASTGNESFIYLLVLLGGASLVAGLVINKRKA
jgi:hypothetical protein